MRQATWIRGRRGAVAGASAVVVCLGGVLAACGGGGTGDGYVAVGAAGGSPPASSTAVAPTGDVSLVPLDEASGSKGAGSGGGSQGASDPGGARKPGTEPAASPSASAGQQAPPRDESGSGRTEGRAEGRTEESSPPSSSSGSSSSGGSDTSPGGPAKLTVSDPEREATDKRWCEKVTVGFHNTGGSAVRSGTVTFETHIIGALGIDWATIKSAEKLPAPVAAGARKEKTWTVCVEAWRVPLGMHIETQDVSVRWE
ncbi:hypothetical protein G5C60_18295 [Streptomyces sp. HC44]|uniref:Uncharacterized protein n=1 Tax=Streptomyces scabichelini TaxID=2711217 RepID=A0A6G4V6L3_9ACTN|nr:hypothetical protein [Streptomyces scabichelini]NGO09497.1 hypothetical protein [Streptomyces scabichelini]